MTREKRKLYIEKRRLHRQKRRAKKLLYAEKKRLHRRARPALVCVMLSLLSVFLALIISVGIINAVVIGATAGDGAKQTLLKILNELLDGKTNQSL